MATVSDAARERVAQGESESTALKCFRWQFPGYTSHQGLAWLRRDIDYLQPDVVIASFGWNDASASDAPDREAIDTRWWPVAIRWLIDHSQAFAHATRWLRSRNASQAVVRRRAACVAERNTWTTSMRLFGLAKDRKAAVIVIGAPYRDSVTNPPEAQLMTQYRASLKSEMQQSQTPYLEILELTEAAGSVNEGFFGELIHPNHMGHRLMASELLKLMAQRHLLGRFEHSRFCSYRITD